MISRSSFRLNYLPPVDGDYGVVTTSSGRLFYALQNNVAHKGLHAAPSGLDLGDIADEQLG